MNKASLPFAIAVSFLAASTLPAQTEKAERTSSVQLSAQTRLRLLTERPAVQAVNAARFRTKTA